MLLRFENTKWTTLLKGTHIITIPVDIPLADKLVQRIFLNNTVRVGQIFYTPLCMYLSHF